MLHRDMIISRLNFLETLISAKIIFSERNGAWNNNYLAIGGGQSKFSLYISDMGLLSSNEKSMKETPLLGVTPSAYKISISEGSYSLLDISIAYNKIKSTFINSQKMQVYI